MMLTTPTRIDPDWPPIDERLVEPGTPYEMIDGKLVRVSPAREPHARLHSKIGGLVEAHASDEFLVASEMLTRVSQTSDIAPDVAVYPLARDPVTGGRQLEHVAFEVVSTQSLKNAARKAELMAARGVRRVFAIDVRRSRVLAWSVELAAWSPLDLAGRIEDPVFAVPVPIAALLDAGKADDAMARALEAKRNPVIEDAKARASAEGERRGLAEGRAQGQAEGRAQGLEQGRAEGSLAGLADGLLALLAARRLFPDPADLARITGEREPSQLRAWLLAAATAGSIAEVLAVCAVERDLADPTG